MPVRKKDMIAKALRERFIDWDNMRLKIPIHRIAYLLNAHPMTVRFTLHSLGFYADSTLQLYPIRAPENTHGGETGGSSSPKQQQSSETGSTEGILQ